MTRKRRTLKVPKNDFEYDEGEVCGFTSEVPIAGDCISSFSFDDDAAEAIETNTLYKSYESAASKTNSKANSIVKDIRSTNTTIENIANTSLQKQQLFSPTEDIFDNRRTPLPNGAAPAIDGETPTIKRSYTLRGSTIRKINELKHLHPDINVCVSTIVDIAIDHYHNYIVNEGGTQ